MNGVGLGVIPIVAVNVIVDVLVTVNVGVAVASGLVENHGNPHTTITNKTNTNNTNFFISP